MSDDSQIHEKEKTAMTSLHSKSEQLTKCIEAKAAELGLVFVGGPNTAPLQKNSPLGPIPDAYAASGQERMGFSFSVTEKG